MNPKKRDSSITAFTQHGFFHEGTSGEQAFGTCPFCSKKRHFYINRNTHNWDCKSCAKKGGYQTFLKYTADIGKENFKGNEAIEFSKDRGIKLSTLREAGIGINPANRKIIIPVWDAKKEKIWDVRIYEKTGLKSTSGCKVGLYRWEELASTQVTTIWLCEGEWDGLVIAEVIKELKLDNHVAVAVPGAATFKAEWICMFEGKDVKVLYDHDSAGFEGSKKVHNSLSQVCKSLKYIHWPETCKEGWDVRDQYNEMGRNGRRLFAFLNIIFKDFPPGVESIEEAQFGSDVKIALTKLEGEGLSASAVYEGYRKWLKLPSTDVIDIMFGTVIANRLPGDPLWLFLVAPSGGTKTELIMSLMTSPKMVTTTTITAPALISGANIAGGNDPSLLRIMNERMLLIKDFTTILSMNAMFREEIFGILRDAYDGRIEKRFGNGVYRLYDPCRFGILAGVTPMIELFTEEHTALGERFLRYRLHLSPSWDDQRDILRQAVTNTTHEEQMRAELQELGVATLNHEFKVSPVITDKIIDRVLCLAQWTALMRATIIRDKFTKEVTHKPFSELGTRLAKQFCKLLLGIGMFRRINVVTESEYKIVKDIALGTVPSRMEEILRSIYKHNKSGNWDVKEVAEIINLPQMTVGRIVENLGMLGILQKNRITEFKMQWALSSNIIDIIERADIY